MRGLISGLCAVLLIACGDDGGVADGESTTTGGGTEGPSTSSMSASGASLSSSGTTGTESSSDSGTSESTGLGSESTSASTSGTDTGSSSGSTTDDTTTMPSESSSSEGGGLLPNGQSCMDSDECASGNCYLAGVLGGICGECLVDADCVWGCAPPNPLAMPPEGSICDDGGLGAGCETDGACQDPLVCTEIVDVPGIIAIGGCSECATDADCPELCSPDYDSVFTEFAGHWACVDIGSQPLGAGCDFAGSGDQACASGFCGVADIMGLLQLGICSNCFDDGDCPMGTTCEAPTVELDGTVTPGSCV